MTDYTVLPANSSLLERGLDMALDKLIERIAPPFPELMNPRTAPAAFLPYLAADRGVNEWSATADESEKRLTVELAWPTKRQAGTRIALENAVRGLELVPEVTAWYEQVPRGEPYSFRVRAFAQNGYTEALNERLDRRLGEAKSERDTMSVAVGLTASGAHFIGAATVGGEVTTIYPFVLDGLEVSGQSFRAAGLYNVETTTIYPMGA